MKRGLTIVWAGLLSSCVYISEKEHTDRVEDLAHPIGLHIDRVTPQTLSACSDTAALSVEATVDGAWAGQTFEVLYSFDGRLDAPELGATAGETFQGRAPLNVELVVDPPDDCDTGQACEPVLSVGLRADDGTQATAEHTGLVLVPNTAPDIVLAGLASAGGVTAFSDLSLDANPADSVPLSTHPEVVVGVSDALLAAGLDASGTTFEVLACPPTVQPNVDVADCVAVRATESSLTVQNADLVVAAPADAFATAACADPTLRWALHLHVVGHPCDDEAWIDLANAPLRVVLADCDGDNQTVAQGDCNDDDATVALGASDPPYDGVDSDCGNDDDFDADGDGVQCAATVDARCAGLGGTDCRDDLGHVYPGATEVCDANDVDEDCDGLADDLDLQGAANPTPWYEDADGDGYGDAASQVSACDAPGGYVADATDCDDALSTVAPNLIEVPGDLANADEDCSGGIDCFVDADGDGYGADAATVVADDGDGACLALSAEGTSTDDCDDGAAAIHPGAAEVCDPNDVDEDCDGAADDSDPGGAIGGTSVWVDNDGDGFGDPALVTTLCDPTSGVDNGDDCDDSNGGGAINPGRADVCNGLDDDCSGYTDDGGDCDCDVVYFGGHVYRTCLDDFEDWNTALATCRGVAGYDKVTLNGPGEEAFLFANTRTRFQTGLNDRATEGSFEWADGSPVGYTNWHAGEPDPAGPEEDCVIAEASWGWWDGDCAYNDANVCESCMGTWFADADGDGHGDPDRPLARCGQPSGYVAMGDDCDDSDSATWCPCETRAGPDGDYEFCTQATSWNTARTQCQTQGGRLLTIDDPAEAAFIEAEAAGLRSGGWWLAQTSTSGTWEWEAGGGTYEDWSFNEPNPFDTQRACAAVNQGNRSGWTSLYCDMQLPYICEPCPTWYADVDGDGLGDPATPTVACAQPVGRVLDDRDCDDNDASIGEDWYDDADGDGFGDPRVGVSGTCAQPPGYVSNADDCLDEVGRGDTVNPLGNEVCNGLDDDCDGVVDDSGCSGCSRATWGGHAYLFCSFDNTWGSHRNGCVDSDYDLVSVQSGDENQWLRAFAHAQPGIADRPVWIGLGDSVGNTWSDGSAVTYTNWRAGEPSGGGQCAMLEPDGRWGDGSCGTLLGTVCESDCGTWYADRDGDGFGDVGTTTSACGTPPPGFVADRTDCDDDAASVHPGAGCGDCITATFDGHTYEICDSRWGDWATAAADCASRDLGLLHLDNGLEGSFVEAEISRLGFEARYWIGASDLGDEGVWTWQDGTSAIYQNWGASQPDNAGPGEHCAELTAIDGSWRDQSCGLQRPWICESCERAWYRDGDGDGYGNPADMVMGGCTAPVGRVADNTDCDDNNAGISPAVVVWADADGDGYGDPFVTSDICADSGAGWTDNAQDCDDASGLAGPGGTEVCNGRDDDCNGQIDEVGCGNNCTVQGWRGSTYLSCTVGWSWPSAAQQCIDNGYTLVVVEDAEEMAWLAEHGTPDDQQYWVGLSDMDADDQFDWVDGATHYEDWAANEPDHVGAAGVYLDPAGGGKLLDKSASELARMLCKTDCGLWWPDEDGDGYGNGARPAVSHCGPPPGHAGNAVDCDDTDATVHPGTGTCACTTVPGPVHDYAVCAHAVDWDVARADCRARNQALVAFDDADEQAFVDAAVADAVWWTGGTDSAGSFGWENGEDFGAVTWAAGQPDDLNGEDCVVELSGETGLADVRCEQQHGFICEDCPVWYDDIDGDGYGDQLSGRVACDRPVTGTLDGSDCDDGDGAVNVDGVETCNGLDDDCNGQIDEGVCTSCTAVSHAGASYLACSGSLSWAAAQADCQSRGWADLVSIDNPDTQDFVQGLREIGLDGVWIGLEDSGGGFAWSDGTALSYEGWAGGQPTGNVGDDCAFLGNGGWVQTDCASQRAWVCESCLSPWYLDRDGDGYGDPAVAISACGQPAGYSASPDDCDDFDDQAIPGSGCTDCAIEVWGGSAYQLCDTLANEAAAQADCASRGGALASLDTSDEQAVVSAFAALHLVGDPWIGAQDCAVLQGGNSLTVSCTQTHPSVCEQRCGTWWRDADGDGYGDADVAIEACGQLPGWVDDDTDCDDADAGAYPGLVVYADSDGDGYGDPFDGQDSCTAPATYVDDDGDCDDTDGQVNPDAFESCDGFDNDCDGAVDPGVCAGCTTRQWAGHSYLICAVDTWQNTRSVCNNNGWDMVTLSGSQEENWLNSVVQPDYWIGYNDLGGAGFVWDDGTVSGYENWALGQPTDTAGEDCVSVATIGWDDRACGDSAAAVCESCWGRWYLDRDGDGFGDPASAWSSCDSPGSGWVDNGDDCDDADGTAFPGSGTCPCALSTYQGTDYLVCDPLRSWDQALQDCRSRSMELVTVHDAGELAFLQGIAPSHWTGGHDRGTEGTWEWSSGEPFSYTFWAVGEPEGLFYEDCVDSAGVERPCTDPLPYVCEACPTWYVDGDGDGYGDPGSPVVSCANITGSVQNGEDCDDADPLRNPETRWRPDRDGDGYGDAYAWVEACVAPSDHVADASDCDDQRFEASPVGTEACNGYDDDCNGLVDDGAVCAAGCRVYDIFGATYLWCDTATDRDSARAMCQGLGGYDLVSVDGVPEAGALRWDLKNAGGGTWWLGLTDSAGSYTWPDGTAATTFDWAEGEPSGAGACTVLSPDGWHEADCGDTNPFTLCESTCGRYWPDADGDGWGDPNGSSVTACVASPAGLADNDLDCDDTDGSAFPGAGTCGCAVVDNGDDHYEICPIELPWFFAEQDCAARGLDLVTVDDATEAAFLSGLLGTDHWTGLNDQLTEGDFVWERDGTGGGYVNWSGAEPDDDLQSDCVTLAVDGTSRDAWCEAAHPYVCEACPAWFHDGDGDGYGDPLDRQIACSQPPSYVADDRDCDDSDADISPADSEACNGRDDDCDGVVDQAPTCEPACVASSRGGTSYLFCQAPETWDDAASACMAVGYDLVTLEDPMEQGWVWDTFTALTPAADAWIGLNDQAAEGNFVWDSGSNASYTNWAGGVPPQPDDAGGNEDCAMISSAWNGAWTDESCALTAPYVCETCEGTWYADRDGDSFGDPAVAVSACGQPDGYVLDASDLDDTNAAVTDGGCQTHPFDGSLYRFCTGTMDWLGAQADCAAQGGHLVTLDNQTENVWVGQAMDNVLPGVPWWTGYNDRGSEGVFGWEDGTPPSWENWAATEPSAVSPTEDCVTLTSLFYEYDVRECGFVYSWICELE